MNTYTIYFTCLLRIKIRFFDVHRVMKPADGAKMPSGVAYVTKICSRSQIITQPAIYRVMK